MTDDAAAAGGVGRRLDRAVGRLIAPESVALRQVPFTLAYAVAWVLLPAGGPAGARPWLWTGPAMVLAAQVLGVVLPWSRIGVAWQAALPLIQVGALVALGGGSGAAGATVDALLMLPVAGLGVLATWSGVVLAAAAAVGLQAWPAPAGPGGVPERFLPQTVVVPLVALLVALATFGVTRYLRALAREPSLIPQEELIGAVGHDLRSPLTSVLGYAQILAAGSLTDEQHGYVRVIERNGRRLLRTIDELMVSVGLTVGEPGRTRRDVDLAEVARTCGAELGPAARDAGLSFTMAAPGPVPVRGDPELLAQLCLTLVGRAVKETPRGGAVTTRVRLDEDARREAVIEVTDSGAGLGPEDLGRLTERLRRARRSTGGQVLGLGLGLPVAHAIADAHGGTLDVDGTLGEGTRVTVRLPAGPPAPAGSPEGAASS
ncbi:sensor histidine kinase [Myceligenerans indicum]|uniref:Sensor-like histidine kinase SenX3 n=1 Tax=Myceligenerans indicum TaxID=2593663 RepID=A0ABS1LNA8_9MICO|nr:HAMP domain-containing sensor histidine kinase [Myceligenerans indicum]MBL0887716.1 HAMP domain-containing histidine kinase [Myceligenerans indicum]